MIHAHIPDLSAIERLQDPQIKFYSTVGAVVSLSAAIELTILDIFTKGLGIDRELAGSLLFKAKAASLQRDIAIEAMNARLKGNPLLAEWNPLAQRLVKATGQSGLRHLIAHNIVHRFEMSGAISGAAISAVAISGGPEEQFVIFQDQLKVLAGIHKPQQAEAFHLLAFCRELVTLLTDLDSLLAQIP